MAWAEQRGTTWRIVFRYSGQKRSFTTSHQTAADAEASATATDELLRLVKRGLVTVPAGCSLEEFLAHQGKPLTAIPDRSAKSLTLGGLRDAYLAAQTNKLEDTTLAGIRLHFGHLTRLVGPGKPVAEVGHADLQAYIDRRAAEWIDPNVYRVRRRALAAAKKPRKNRKPPPPESEDKPRRHPSPATIRKEIVSLRTAWNWARNHRGLAAEFPGRGLAYVKGEEARPFVCWDEAERLVAAGDDPDRVWDGLYLRPAEVVELLAWVKTRPVGPWVYPMFCFAAYTGARRSEVLRATPADVDLAGGVVTIREKKRDRRRLTTRRVPITPVLRAVLADWLGRRAGGRTLFCRTDGTEVGARDAHNLFTRTVAGSKWGVVRGWHVLRHSFISALASTGADQRVIDEFVGHSTEEQRRRYRHIFPAVKEKAIADAFGNQ